MMRYTVDMDNGFIWTDYTDALTFTPPDCAASRWLWFDLTLDTAWFADFAVCLLDADGAELHRWLCAPLTQCQTRIVLPVEAVDWMQVARIALRIARSPEFPVRCACTTPVLSAEEPPLLEHPALPAGPLLDPFGQSPLHPRASDIHSEAELRTRLTALRRPVPPPAAGLSRWGGDAARRVEATGFFRTHHDGTRWWLVDPDGCLFWSAGADCVHPTIDHETRLQTGPMQLDDAVSWLPPAVWTDCYGTNPYHDPNDREVHFLVANFIRVFGLEGWHEAWRQCAHGEFRRLGFNTIGNWSDEATARRTGLPYVRPLELGFRFTHAPMIASCFPDPFAPGIEDDIAVYAEQLRDTADDPALLGYFLHNEPGWHGYDNPPAAAMLAACESAPARTAFVDFLRERHQAETVWGGVPLARIAQGRWTAPLPAEAREDVEAFSTVLMARLCDQLSAACRRVDPNHLNLGVRWWTFPPLWALRAMGSFDVISFNYYQPKVDMVSYGAPGEEPGARETLTALHRPALIGEWHIGSLDGGLPSAGLYRAENQVERGKAYRYYLEQTAALPWCVGAHWFNFYDRNALYCASSNENYNIGFFDLCHVPHEALGAAAQASHARLYAVAAGEAAPFDEPVAYVFPSR